MIIDSIEIMKPRNSIIKPFQPRNNAILVSKGVRGPKGDTPVKGVDYWTESDKQEIIDELKDLLEGIVEEKLSEDV